MIPTLGAQVLLDRAIDSALNAAPSVIGQVLVSVNGKESQITATSAFRKDDRVRWQFSEIPSKPHWISYNNAVAAVPSGWVLLLSDDDYLLPALGDELKYFPWDNSRALFATHLLFENLVAGTSRESKPPPSRLNAEQVLEAHFDRKFLHNLSLFVFSKEAFLEVGGYVPNLYPSGLFVDTVLHGWLCATADLAIGASQPVLVRSQSAGQSSAVFRIGKEVNHLMQSVVVAFTLNRQFAERVRSRYGSVEKFYQTLLVERFGTEWGKLGNPVYGKGPFVRLKLVLSFLLWWEVPRREKFHRVLSATRLLKFAPSLHRFLLHRLKA